MLSMDPKTDTNILHCPISSPYSIWRDLQNNTLQGIVPESLGELEDLHLL